MKLGSKHETHEGRAKQDDHRSELDVGLMGDYFLSGIGELRGGGQDRFEQWTL